MEADQRRELENAWQAIAPQIALLCRRLGGSADRGDEILQRATVRIVRSLAGYRGEASLMTWASAIAQHERDRLFVQEMTESRRRAPAGAEALAELEARPADGGARSCGQ